MALSHLHRDAVEETQSDSSDGTDDRRSLTFGSDMGSLCVDGCAALLKAVGSMLLRMITRRDTPHTMRIEADPPNLTGSRLPFSIGGNAIIFDLQDGDPKL